MLEFLAPRMVLHMTQHELNDDDVFHVLGFTNRDILSEAHMALMRKLPVRPGPKLVEVYALDSVTAPDPAAFKLYGDYVSVYFYNDTALTLSRDFGIELPPVIAKITRANLPVGVGTSIRVPALG
jgi:hypothetical protein